MQITEDEKLAIDALRRVAKMWPKSLWLFSNGTLSVLKKKDGKRVMTRTGGVDPQFVVGASIPIESDSGDW